MSRIEQVWKKIMTEMNQIEFLQPQEFSPYMEMSELEITESQNGKCKIYYNGMYRFEEVFSKLFVSTEITESEKAWLYDVFLHYLLQLEFRNGLSQKEFDVRNMMQKLGDGSYGEIVKELLTQIDRGSVYRIAEGMYRQKHLGASVELFGEICVQVLEKSVLYKNTLDKKTLILCLKKEEMENREKNVLIELLERLFLPLDYELALFAEGTLGVIGEDVTMMPEYIVPF